MKRIGIIIDFDNTLVETYSFVVDHIISTCKYFDGKTPSKEEILKILNTNPPFEDIFKKLFGEKAEEFLAKYRETAMDTPYTAIPGGSDAVKSLRAAGVKIVVVSNRINKLTERLSQAKYNPDDFEIIQPASPKPSKDAYIEALDSLDKQGIEKDSIYIVGDSLDDFLACPDGLSNNFYGVTTGLNSKEEFLHLGVNVSNILSSVTELPVLIL